MRLTTRIGTVSLDVTTSSTRLPGQERLQGQSYGMAYNKNIPQTGTNFALGAYRFSTSGYLSLNDAVNLRDQYSSRTTDNFARQKSRLDLNISQKLGDGNLSLYGSSIDYYGTSLGRQTSLTVGYGSNWQSVSWNVSLQGCIRMWWMGSVCGNDGMKTRSCVRLSVCRETIW
ncbi:MAG: fimbria/pilus outer membrane usher protein [Pseudomonadota bacterium]